MEKAMKTKITVRAAITTPLEKVWKLWTSPEHITQWNNASEDWHTPTATNDLRVGGKFLSHMAAKDGSMGFDFEGIYTKVDLHRVIEYGMSDGREVKIKFTEDGNETIVEETFDAEDSNPVEMQREGWQAILDNFKKYVESNSSFDKLTFEIHIQAPVDKVYATMLDQEHYKTWTSAFNPTSHFKGSWDVGSKILFIGCDDEGNEGGMVSRIRENIPNEFVSIEHIGLLQGDKEITSGKEIEEWAGALENYIFEKKGDNETLLKVDLDSNSEFKSYFSETYPKALEILKQLCES